MLSDDLRRLHRSFPPVGPSRRQGRQSEARASNLFTIFLASTPDLERFFQVSKCLIPPFSVHSHPSVQNQSTLQLIYHLLNKPLLHKYSGWRRGVVDDEPVPGRPAIHQKRQARTP